MNKWLSIQGLRGLAALGVVMFHATFIEQKYSGGDGLLPGFLYLGQSGVDLFFVISGFIMVTVTRGRFGRNRESLRFLWGRFTRIYPTYWFYFFLTLAIFLVRPEWVNSSQGNQADLLKSFLLWPDDRLPLVMVAWSLIHELWFYLVFAAILRFRERLLLPFLLLWGAVVIVVNTFVTISDFSPAIRIILHPYSLEFIVGALVALFVYHGRTDLFSSRKALLITILVVSAGSYLVYTHDLLNHENLRAGVVGTLYGLLVLTFAASEKAGRIAVGRPVQFLGDISYTVYLSHTLVLSAIGRMWVMMNPVPDRLYDNLLAFLVMLAAVVGYGWAGYRLIERPALTVSHRLRARWFDAGTRGARVPTVATDPVR
jgi:exopolysaccharide production protein ExoZ